MNALLDSDVLLDFLDGYPAAAEEIARHRDPGISVISWMEVMTGARNEPDEDVGREYLRHFRVAPVTSAIAEEAVTLRRKHRLNLPDAIIWASAMVEKCLLVTRNTKDFPADQPGVRFPYRR